MYFVALIAGPTFFHLACKFLCYRRCRYRFPDATQACSVAPTGRCYETFFLIEVQKRGLSSRSVFTPKQATQYGFCEGTFVEIAAGMRNFCSRGIWEWLGVPPGKRTMKKIFSLCRFRLGFFSDARSNADGGQQFILFNLFSVIPLLLHSTMVTAGVLATVSLAGSIRPPQPHLPTPLFYILHNRGSPPASAEGRGVPADQRIQERLRLGRLYV